MEDFNELNCLNEYSRFPVQQVEEDDIKSVLYFALIWNLFESHTCNRKANTATIADAVNQAFSRGVLERVDFEPFLHYFRNRYTVDGEIKPRFQALNFRKGDKEGVVSAVLLGELDDLNNIVLALLLIILRLRNNLFHGEKDVHMLNFQAENFSVANQVLATFLNAWKKP